MCTLFIYCSDWVLQIVAKVDGTNSSFLLLRSKTRIVVPFLCYRNSSMYWICVEGCLICELAFLFEFSSIIYRLCNNLFYFLYLALEFEGIHLHIKLYVLLSYFLSSCVVPFSLLWLMSLQPHTSYLASYLHRSYHSLLVLYWYSFLFSVSGGRPAAMSSIKQVINEAVEKGKEVYDKGTCLPLNRQGSHTVTHSHQCGQSWTQLQACDKMKSGYFSLQIMCGFTRGCSQAWEIMDVCSVRNHGQWKKLTCWGTIDFKILSFWCKIVIGIICYICSYQYTIILIFFHYKCLYCNEVTVIPYLSICLCIKLLK